MNDAIIILGGNIADVSKIFSNTIDDIHTQIGKVFVASPIYKTKAWGNTNQHDFLNQIIGIKTNNTPIDLLNNLLSIEKKYGRKRDKKYDPRTIDLDILFYNDDIIEIQNLVIPHQKIRERNFVLFPLAAIMPNYIHPIYKKTITELKSQTTDELNVELYV